MPWKWKGAVVAVVLLGLAIAGVTTRSMRVLRERPRPSQGVWAEPFSPEGDLVLQPSKLVTDPSGRRWFENQPRTLVSCPGLAARGQLPAASGVWSPDGTRLAFEEPEGTLHVVGWPDRSPIATAAIGTGARCFSWSAAGRELCVFPEPVEADEDVPPTDVPVLRFDATTLKALGKTTLPRRDYESAFTRSGLGVKRDRTVIRGGLFVAFDAAAHALAVRAFPDFTAVTSIAAVGSDRPEAYAASSDGNTVAVAWPGGRISAWTRDAGPAWRDVAIAAPPSGLRVHTLALSGDGRTIAVLHATPDYAAGRDAAIHDVWTGQLRRAIAFDENALPDEVALSPDGSVLVVFIEDNLSPANRVIPLRLTARMFFDE